MNELPPKTYVIRSVCPGCKHAVVFRFTDPKEVKNFRMSRHTCPYCRRSYFMGWTVDRLPII